MNTKEKQKQLETALINHKPMMLDLRDNQVLLLKWDEKKQNYRGYYQKLGLEIGIWDLSYLLQIANGKTKYKLEVF
jgi:hypothetical protein